MTILSIYSLKSRDVFSFQPSLARWKQGRTVPGTSPTQSLFLNAMGTVFTVAKYRRHRPWGCCDNRQISGTEAYVFLLCLKKILAAQKCDLLHDKWDPGALNLACYSQMLRLSHSLACTTELGCLEQVASVKTRGAEVGQYLQEQGTVTSLPWVLNKRKSPVNIQHGLIEFLRTFCN